jgi:hypothetical protein
MKHLSSNALRFVRWLLLPAVLISACSDGETARGTPDGGGASAGASGSAGTGQGASGAQGMTGSSGAAGSNGSSGSTDSGMGGTTGLRGRTCGSGQPCSAGAKCRAASIETWFDCDCDQSGHFFCDAFAGGGAPPFANCTAESSCKGEPCEQTNGYCTRSCGCDAGCSTDCSDQGPAVGESFLCDRSYCDLEFGRNGGCSFQEGACNYEIRCNPGFAPRVTGSCP